MLDPSYYERNCDSCGNVDLQKCIDYWDWDPNILEFLFKISGMCKDLFIWDLSEKERLGLVI